MHDESQEGQNALAAVAATAAATAQAKYQVDNGNGAWPPASNLPQAASQAMANYAAGMGMWPGQMSDGQNPEWQALFSFLGDGQ